MGKAQEYQQIILDTNEWFENKIKQLKLIVDEKNDKKILFQGKDGENAELPADLKKGFHLGILTAIDVLGQFPVKITKPNDTN